MKDWARRARRLHAELAGVADLRPRGWWVIAAGAALPWRTRESYVASDAEPATDTFIGVDAGPPRDPLALARAAQTAIRELRDQLVDQPLAVNVTRDERGAATETNTLSTAAFARGDRVWCVRLDEPGREFALDAAPEVPFVCISLGDEAVETARHGHRRAWLDGRGPWLGIGSAGGMTVVSTCHFVVDGYGHARLTARIAELAAAAPPAPVMQPRGAPLPPVSGSIPLEVTWRELTSRPRALELAYALGRLLHRLAGEPRARFSPTFQIPLAPGADDDPLRRRRRVVMSIASVRFTDSMPEPYAEFAARTKATIAREAAGDGISARLMATAQAMPVPLAWKRRAITASRPRWLDTFVAVIGGRGCVSRIAMDVPMPPACAVSSPGRLATPSDPLGSCVVTVIDDGRCAAITLCGSGATADAGILDELLSLLPR